MTEDTKTPDGADLAGRVEPLVSLDDLDNLRHMVGANEHTPRRDWGYRNHYAASRGGPDEDSLRRMEKAGLVQQGRITDGLVFFHCTETGCKAAGLNAKQTKQALGGSQTKKHGE